VDGNDVVLVHESVQKAVRRARRGRGPGLVELVTYRYRAHAEGMEEVRSQEEIGEWRRRDPVATFRKTLMEQGILAGDDMRKMDAEVQAEIEAAIRFAEESPRPEPEVAFEDLFA
jgi:pyruvate dehydrogenase E1 component alpha subunit